MFINLLSTTSPEWLYPFAIKKASRILGQLVRFDSGSQEQSFLPNSSHFGRKMLGSSQIGIIVQYFLVLGIKYGYGLLIYMLQIGS
jgi:hypothetical protein